MGIFRTPVPVILVVTFPLNVDHASSRETRVPDQEIHWLPILETTCNINFLLPSLEESCSTLFLYNVVLKVLLPSEMRILTPLFEQPNSIKTFLGLVTI
jgi:hypothetical protein